MSDRVRQGRGRELAREMAVTDEDVTRRTRAVGLESADLPRIALVRGLVLRQVMSNVDTFGHLRGGLERGRDQLGPQEGHANPSGTRVAGGGST